MNCRQLIIGIILSLQGCCLWGQAHSDSPDYLVYRQVEGGMPLAENGRIASLHVSAADDAGILRVAKLLREDFVRVTGLLPDLITDPSQPGHRQVVIIGSVEKSPLIRQLTDAGKVDTSPIRGKWETYLIQVVDDPFPGVDQALVIAGSDKRGTIYGMFELSRQMGVSPWYWWADVPPESHATLYLRPGLKRISQEPAVRYRGIFLNDEEPALGNWARQTFGGFNHLFYNQVFELILRLKGNFLWPAMWGKSLFDDDSLSYSLADEYGVVLSTSHHEPFVRAQSEWHKYGSGAWNYETNDSTLRAFWRKGIERMGTRETLVTIGMRGDGDEPMTEGTAIELLERIVKDQRTLLEEVTGQPAEATPQVWALYKEVQDYYDKGMTVPEDVTLLLCDDNWGNLRRLPNPDLPGRKGGYGIYYHFDYVGGPRSYKWLNTNQIERVWEQMHLAYAHGVDRLWVVNVGDLKPMELPVSFFLDYAYDPQSWPVERLDQYTTLWAQQQFGTTYAAAIGSILDRYTKYNSRRKPELLSPDTYSLVHYHEADRILTEYKMLADEATAIYQQLPDAFRDAYYQLVLFPVQITANLNEMYVTAARNRQYVQQGRAATNALAERVEYLFEQDSLLTNDYHTKLSRGKWNHMMSQTHMGYTSWFDPKTDTMPAVQRIRVPEKAGMGISVEGSADWYPATGQVLRAPQLDPFSRRTLQIEIFNRGKTPFSVVAKTKARWLQLSSGQASVQESTLIDVSIDWSKAPKGESEMPIVITGPEGQKATVMVSIHHPVDAEQVSGFVESNGMIAIEAAHFSGKYETKTIGWKVIPNLGRTGSAVSTYPVIARPNTSGTDTPWLQYDVYTFSAGKVKVKAFFSPTLDYHDIGGMKYAMAFDDKNPQIINMHKQSLNRSWGSWVSDNIIVVESEHLLEEAGAHTLKYFMVDPGLVLQKIIIDFGGLQKSYLGPEESPFVK